MRRSAKNWHFLHYLLLLLLQPAVWTHSLATDIQPENSGVGSSLLLSPLSRDTATWICRCHLFFVLGIQLRTIKTFESCTQGVARVVFRRDLSAVCKQGRMLSQRRCIGPKQILWLSVKPRGFTVDEDFPNFWALTTRRCRFADLSIFVVHCH